MLIRERKKIDSLKHKQKKILEFAKNIGQKKVNLKIDHQLSPVSWHLLHCVFIEALWIRSKFLQDDYYKNKLESIADPSKVPLNKRNNYSLEYCELIIFTTNIFKENIVLIKKISKIKESYNLLSYILDFLNQHHAQHIETLRTIMNLFNMKFNQNFHEIALDLCPNQYSFSGIEIKKGAYEVGASMKHFAYDNEKPKNIIYLDDFTISKKLITISEWLGFIKEKGYQRKEFWSKQGWQWIKKNKILFPLNWKYSNKKAFAISSPTGYQTPKNDMAVSNISKFELDAFASWNNLRIPHEFEWELSSKKINNLFQVWEWSSNKFFGYKGFLPYPYDEYSLPWFNNSYYTLKGGSIYTLKDVKRYSFRNFYKPNTRHIFSGGRLCI